MIENWFWRYSKENLIKIIYAKGKYCKFCVFFINWEKVTEESNQTIWNILQNS